MLKYLLLLLMVSFIIGYITYAALVQQYGIPVEDLIYITINHILEVFNGS